MLPDEVTRAAMELEFFQFLNNLGVQSSPPAGPGALFSRGRQINDCETQGDKE
jgi:hypothetical protein